MGRVLLIIGLALAGVGLLMMAGFPLGRLPGDFTVRRGSVTFYVPLTSSLLVSVLLTVLLHWLRR